MGKTKIEWTSGPDGSPGRTWNPVRGCTRVSAGCENCYAESFAARFGAVPGHAFEGFARMVGHDARWTGRVELIPHKLGEPLRWRKPSRIFVNSMSDLFHEALDPLHIADVFGVMAKGRQHTFQVLTKRPERMARLLRETGNDTIKAVCSTYSTEWPLPNVWLGVSVEDQETADERIPLLLETPAAVRFASYEPALGPVDFSKFLIASDPDNPIRGSEHSRTDGGVPPARVAALERQRPRRDKSIGHEQGNQRAGRLAIRNLDWVIVGGESGPGARPFDLAWARSTIRQCREAGVKVFVKQLGRWIALNGGGLVRPHGMWPERYLHSNGDTFVPGFIGEHTHDGARGAVAFSLCDRKGGNMGEWPEDLRVREFPA